MYASRDKLVVKHVSLKAFCRTAVFVVFVVVFKSLTRQLSGFYWVLDLVLLHTLDVCFSVY